MPIATHKADLLKELESAYARLHEEAASIPPALERCAGLEGGISPCDLIAYQIGWGRLLLSWDALEARGEAVDMPAPGFKWNQLGLLANSFHQARSGHTLERLLAEFELLVGRIRRFIDTCTEDELFRIGVRHWAGEKWPVAKWIQVNTIAPYKSARTKLRRWKKSAPSYP